MPSTTRRSWRGSQVVTQFPVEGRLQGREHEGTCAATTVLCVPVLEPKLFSSGHCGPGTKTLWNIPFFWTRMIVFSISLELIPWTAQPSAQGTCWQALTLAAQQSNGKSSGLVPRRPFLSYSLQIILSTSPWASSYQLSGSKQKHKPIKSPDKSGISSILTWTLTTLSQHLCSHRAT